MSENWWKNVNYCKKFSSKMGEKLCYLPCQHILCVKRKFQRGRGCPSHRPVPRNSVYATFTTHYSQLSEQSSWSPSHTMSFKKLQFLWFRHYNKNKKGTKILKEDSNISVFLWVYWKQDSIDCYQSVLDFIQTHIVVINTLAIVIDRHLSLSIHTLKFTIHSDQHLVCWMPNLDGVKTCS